MLYTLRFIEALVVFLFRILLRNSGERKKNWKTSGICCCKLVGVQLLRVAWSSGIYISHCGCGGFIVHGSNKVDLSKTDQIPLGGV